MSLLSFKLSLLLFWRRKYMVVLGEEYWPKKWPLVGEFGLWSVITGHYRTRSSSKSPSSRSPFPSVFVFAFLCFFIPRHGCCSQLIHILGVKMLVHIVDKHSNNNTIWSYFYYKKVHTKHWGNVDCFLNVLFFTW